MLKSVPSLKAERSARGQSPSEAHTYLARYVKRETTVGDLRTSRRIRLRRLPLKATQVSDELPELPEETHKASVLKSLQYLQNITQQQWASFMELARIHNYIPSCLLVLMGAWKSAGLSWLAFQHVRVWIMSVVAGGVAIGSVIVNDYFDYIDGVDLINAPDKPLPSGTIQPDAALLVTLIIYVSVLVAGCAMEPPILRWIIAYSSASTLIYTPLLKSLTLIKNFVVAAVIALSPIAGALAAGTGQAGMYRLFHISAYIFGAFVFREILMDIKDAEGDQSTGVYTLPVVLGRSPALLFACLFFSLTSFVVGRALLTGSAVQSLSRFLPFSASRSVVLSVFGLTLVPMYHAAFESWRRVFDETCLAKAIDRVMVYIGVSFLALILFS